MGERNWSVSDRFIFVMGELQKMEYVSDDPYRFAKIAMKSAAERVLYEACITAGEIIHASKVYDCVSIDAAKSTGEDV